MGHWILKSNFFSKRFYTMMPYTKYLFQNKLQLTNCLLKFNKNFKITLFSMRKRRNTENKTGRCTADLKSNAPRLVLFCFVKKQCQTQRIGFLNPTCSGIRPGSCPPSRLLLARGVGCSAFLVFFFIFSSRSFHNKFVGKALKG